MGKWNESYDYNINLGRIDSFLSLGEERRKSEYEKVEGRITLSKRDNTQRRGKSFDTTKGSWITQELGRITFTKI